LFISLYEEVMLSVVTAYLRLKSNRRYWTSSLLNDSDVVVTPFIFYGNIENVGRKKVTFNIK